MVTSLLKIYTVNGKKTGEKVQFKEATTSLLCRSSSHCVTMFGKPGTNPTGKELRRPEIVIKWIEVDVCIRVRSRISEMEFWR